MERPPLTPEQLARKEFWRSRSRGLATYHEYLFALPRVVDWQPESVFLLLRQHFLRTGGGPLTVVDLGCGAGIALCGIAYWLQQQGQIGRLVGLDKVKSGSGGTPFDLFPVDSAARQDVLTLFADEIGLPEPPPPIGHFVWPELHRLDLEQDPWPLAANCVHVALSSFTLPFLVDKLRSVERVYETLAPGGVAMLQLDLSRYPGDVPSRLERIELPGDVPFETILAEQRQRGVPIFGTVALPPKQTIYTLMMRKRPGTTLDFGLRVVHNEQVSAMPGAPPDAWGTWTRYGPR